MDEVNEIFKESNVRNLKNNDSSFYHMAYACDRSKDGKRGYKRYREVQ